MTRPTLLSELVVMAADRHPEREAVAGGGERLDYGALAARVAALGTALVRSGVQPGDRVAIFAPKSVDTFAAIHASLYAGAVVAPIDPLAPPPAVAAVVDQLTPTAVVLGPSTAPRWPTTANEVISVGTPADGVAAHLGWDEAAATPPSGPVRRLGADPAYVITTSGSTGRPKPIVHTHRSGLRYAELAADCYSLGCDDRMANVAPFHFDQSTFELYAAPLVGAAVLLIGEAEARFPATVSERLETERATTVYSVPTIFRQLLDRGALDQRDLRRLRWVLFGGEVYPPRQLAALMRAIPGARFSNVYGPAEVNQCTFHHLDAPPEGDDPVPIGGAWDDTELRLVDDSGVTIHGAGRGELLVRTATAMAGYWNQPEATRQAFLDEEGEGGMARRWYHTGDVVERGADGSLVFVGRVDRQAKVRGVRVELESVESALGAIEGVTAAAAVVTDGPEQTLVGVVESATLADGAAVTAELRAVLAPGSVPDRVVVVDALPRTASGKVDARAAVSLVPAGDPIGDGQETP